MRKEMFTQVDESTRHEPWLRKLVIAVLLCAMALLLVAPGAWAQTPKAKEQKLPEHPAKLDKRPVPPMPKGSANSNARVIADEDPNGNLYVAGELIVTYERDASVTDQKRARETISAQVEDNLKGLPKVEADVLSFSGVKNERAQKARQEDLKEKKQELERNPDVASVSYNYVTEPNFVPNDQFFAYQWDMKKIGAPAAWDRASGYGAKVAVLDTGFYTGHPDLRGQIVWQYDFFNGDSVANVDYGYAASAHGTHVAGTVAAATNNGTGVAGTAPRSQILAAKVCGPMWVASQGRYDIKCDSQATINALNYFATYASYSGIKVANLSLGGYATSAAYKAAIDNAWNRGIVVVAAAGNDNTNATHYPSAFANAIAVAATDHLDRKAPYSNFGYIDVAAPGGDGARYSGPDIYSTGTSSYYYNAGTSMAAPHVSGLAALLASQGLNNYQVRYQIEHTATDLGTRGWDQYYGYGRINAAAAVSW